jgi:ribosome maturation factor RimP
MEAEALRDIVEGAVAEAGLLLVDLQLVRTGRRALIRILADREGRITIGECASLSRAVGNLLEAHGAFTEDYTLEVSSPGIGRPLSTETDWRRCRGRIIEVRTPEGTVTGTLAGVEDGVLVMEGDSRIPVDEIMEAREVI